MVAMNEDSKTRSLKAVKKPFNPRLCNIACLCNVLHATFLALNLQMTYNHVQLPTKLQVGEIRQRGEVISAQQVVAQPDPFPLLHRPFFQRKKIINFFFQGAIFLLILWLLPWRKESAKPDNK